MPGGWPGGTWALLELTDALEINSLWISDLSYKLQSTLVVFKKIDNFKIKTRHVSIGQRSSSVVNSVTSLVELIAAMAHKGLINEPGWFEFAGISDLWLNATKINFAIT